MPTPRPRILLATACLAVLLPACVTASERVPMSAEWATNAVWDDGLAEVAVYDASRPIYGAPRPYEAVLLTVKEEFDERTLIKTDDPGDRPTLTVLKLNTIREIATPNYDYRMMTSTFVERSDPARLVKLTSGSHEWCGNTWKAMRNRDGKLTYNWSSYFEGEGDGVQQIKSQPGRDLVEDQLPMTLRGLEFRDGLRVSVRLIPSMATTHAGPVRWQDATVEVTGRESIAVGTGETEAWKVEVRAGELSSTYWFDVGGTHVMLRMESSTGDHMTLKSIERRAYWRL